MADFDHRREEVNTSFKGLSTSVAIFAAIGGISLLGFECMRQLRRLPRTSFVPFWKDDVLLRQGGRGGVDANADDRGGNVIGTRDKLTSEDWEMGHLYMARMFHARFDDWFYATHTGMDTVVYVRFLKACVYWALLQTITTAPILLAVHFSYSKGALLSDMDSASLSHLVVQCKPGDPNEADLSKCVRIPNEQGRELLWIHLCLLWYLTVTWFYSLWWIAKGSLFTRKRWIGELRNKRERAEEAAKIDRAAADPAVITAASATEENLEHGGVSRGDDSDGWRQRTLLVTNLPPTMRDEASVRRYFEEFLRPDDGSPMSSVDDLHSRDASDAQLKSLHDKSGLVDGYVLGERPSCSPSFKALDSTDDTPAHKTLPGGEEIAKVYKKRPSGPEPDTRPHRYLRSPVQTVVLVRKMNELSSMLSRRQEVLGQLEAAHVKLAQSVLTKVGQQTHKMRVSNKDEGGHMGGLGLGKIKGSGRLSALKGRRGKHADNGMGDVEKGAATQLREDLLRLNDLTYRLARFAPGNQGLHMREAQMKGDVEEITKDNIMAETVWEALAEVPRDLLDPFQPVTRLSSLFRGQKVPTIDYLLTKLNLLTALVTEMRARPPTSYEATSTAFVTFRDPRQARLVWRELKSQIVVKVRLAPEVKDLDWERLMRTSFTGDVVRGIGVNTFFWFATILWVIPVGLLSTSLFSVDKLVIVFPQLQKFFQNNPTFKGFVGNTLPSLIVSLLTMCVPEVIFQISKRAQGFVTFSALYDQCLCRYWKFVICNIVIFFCIGATTVQSIIFQVGKDSGVLDNIAFAFPIAAPFYISYLILGMGLHTGFELVGMFIPLVQHWGARKAATPRNRAVKTLPRNFNRYYWLPFHILIVSIVFLFALLQPLVIPFALVYLFVALVVFKKNFAYTYFRRFNEKEGVIYFVRLLRFSLDGLLVGQIVILIFFSVTKQSAVYIAMTAVLLPITVAVKLLATRLWNSQCRALEDEEANALCGIGSTQPLTPSAKKRDYLGKSSSYGHSNDDGHDEITSPMDARASGRYPSVFSAPETNSKILLLWNYIHDRFNANGNDRPSYVVSAQARGSHLSARMVTTAVAGAPRAVARSAAQKTSRIGVAAKKQKSNSGLHVNSIVDGYEDEDEVAQMPPATARTIKESLEQTQEEDEKRKAKVIKSYKVNKLARALSKSSGRSDEAPFLSGMDALANHAPVPSTDDGDFHAEDYGDGEFDPNRNTRRRRSTSGHRHTRRTSSYSTTIVKGRPTDPGDESHLSAPCEADEADVDGRSSKHNSSARAEDADDDREYVSGTEEDEEEDIEGRALVRPHAKIRWDDTPNNSARYNNPFYSVELDPFLWLPRDPMMPIDLCDTVEWHGAALVSSQGGAGKVGEWEDDQEDEGGDEADEQDGDIDGESHGMERQLHGSEEIDIVGPLALRLQEAEDAEEAIDPTASLSRNQLEDYKKAIDEEEVLGAMSPSNRHATLTERVMRSSSLTSRRSGRVSSAGGATQDEHQVQVPPRRASILRSQAAPQVQKNQVRPGTAPEEPIIVSPNSLEDAEETMAQSHSAISFAQSPSAPSHLDSISPASPRGRRSKAREPSHAASHRTADSVIEAGDHAGATRKRTVSMRKALKAEVLEEEYLRTIKTKLSEKKKREKQEADDAAAERRIATAGEMEMHDLEFQHGTKEGRRVASSGAALGAGGFVGSDIMIRHEKRMHPTQAASVSRREGNMSVQSVKAAVASAFSPRKSDGSKSVIEH